MGGARWSLLHTLGLTAGAYSVFYIVCPGYLDVRVNNKTTNKRKAALEWGAIGWQFVSKLSTSALGILVC